MAGYAERWAQKKRPSMKKQRYRNKLDFVEDAFQACWTNANDLIEAAKLLLDNELHGVALSMSVLAIEELGKLFCIDGLLFARSDDDKAKAYAKSLKRHSTKLSSFTLISFLLGNIAQVDPRLKSDPKFAQAIAISINDLKIKGNKVFDLLPNFSFQDLNSLKQQGFYAQPYGNVFKSPNKALTREVSQEIYELAWSAVTTLDFLLKDGNLQRYIKNARSIRGALTEEKHNELKEQAKHLSEMIFATDNEVNFSGSKVH